jgi:RNA polymerase sigma-70 factor (ECF subfamily)
MGLPSPAAAERDSEDSVPKTACLGSDAVRDNALSLIIADFKFGDCVGFPEFYEGTVGRVASIVAAILRSREDIQETVWDVYLHVWRHAAQYDETRGSVLMWLSVIARSRAIDLFRKRRLSALREEDSFAAELTCLVDEPASCELVWRAQSQVAVYAALRTLTARRRRLLGLAFFRGLSHQEIADMTGMPLGSVKSNVRRALADLRREISEA